MASVTLTVDQAIFPIGTSLGAYKASAVGVPPTSSPPPQGPAGSPDDTATVQADGTVTFADLTGNTRYFAYALVSSQHRYISFTPGALSSGEHRTTYDADSDTYDIRAENVTANGVLISFAHLTEDPERMAYLTDYDFAVGTADETSQAVMYRSGDFWGWISDEDDLTGALIGGQRNSEDFPRICINKDGKYAVGDGTGDPLPILEAGYFQGQEIADPSAPAANRGRLYWKDVGGKTALVARFSTGAVQQIAIEP